MHFLRRRRVTPTLDIAPLVDVVFLLLIFFLLCSTFVMPALKLSLPAARNQERRNSHDLVVSVDRQGNFFLNQQPLSLNALKAHLQAQLPGLQHKRLTFRGDARSEYRHFVTVLDLAKELGIEDINLVHQVEKNP